MAITIENVGAVVIGRNEGERLQRSLRALVGAVQRIVYVDSGSTDGSVEFAKSLGVDVVELDTTTPFTMARGRNAGFQRLLQAAPKTEFVQFIDGDCEIASSWLEVASRLLKNEPQIGAICGNRSERFPNQSLYNKITDMDWRGLPGDVKFCGGDVLMRSQAFRDVAGYAERMIAGEDPEICVRLRQSGWKLHRLDEPMTSHDVAMRSFRQLWKRSLRSGHAYAEGAWMHRHCAEQPWKREVRSNFFWGLLLPILIVFFIVSHWEISLLMASLYLVWAWRIALGRIRVFNEQKLEAWLYGFFCMICKVPCALGQSLFYWRYLTGAIPRLIEYKA